MARLREKVVDPRRVAWEVVRAFDLRQPRIAVLTAAVAGAAATVIVAVVLGGRFATFRPSLYVAIETAAAFAGLLAAYLVFFRYRRSARLDDLLLTSGLVVLSLSNLAFGLAPAVLGNFPTRFAVWASISGQLVGSAILAVAAFAPALVFARPRRIAALFGAGSIAVLAVLGLTLGFIPLSLGTAGNRDAVVSLQLADLAVLAVAAYGFTRRAEDGEDTLMSWFAVAAALGAVAAYNFARHPSLEAGWVYTGDACRLLFYGALVAGAAREIRHYWDGTLDAAVLQERRRIARDLHDGLAQELAYIVRRSGRALQEQPHSPLARQIVSAAERAVDESRRVIAALTRPLDEPLEVVLAEAVKDVADRVGTIAALALDRDVLVTADVREALVRIAREAVTNAARHGEAGIVRVELEHAQNGDRARLRIVDDGRGFNSLAARTSRSGGFGIVSMSERAQAVGAVFRVESRLGAGTTVEVELP